jgi:transcriptional regulator with PAS, ATPase and Fis domain
MEILMKTLENIAAVTTTVLISGESGVGKSVAARYIHDLSERKDKPFVVINCGSIPENLIESELFGHMEGSFTGATKGGKTGLIELGDGGTVFLDEVGDLPIGIQVKLLHVIQEKKLLRVGGQNYIDVDIRIIAATNRNLEKMVENGTFREDLYYRLSVVPIIVPPLRERKDEIEELAWKFLSYYNQKYNFHKEFSPDIINFFRCYNWPGNIRELENIIERLVVTVSGGTITKKDLPAGVAGDEERDSSPLVVNKLISLKDATAIMEKQLLSLAVSSSENTYKIAELLGVNQSTVVRKLKTYNLQTEKRRSDDT